MKKVCSITLLAVVILSAFMVLGAGNAVSVDVYPDRLYSPIYDDQHPNYPYYPLWTVRCDDKGTPSDNGLYEYRNCSADASVLDS